MNENSDFFLLDYDRHPAFVGLSSPGNWDAQLVENTLRAIDLDYGSLSKLQYAEDVKAQFQTSTAPRVDALLAYFEKNPCTSARAQSVLRASLLKLREDILAEVLFRKSMGKPELARTEREREVYRALREDGIAVMQLDSSEILRVFQETSGERAAQKQHTLSLQGDRASSPLPLARNYWDRLLRMMNANGVIGGVSAFQGVPLEPIYCALTYSHSGETWWKNCYADVGVPTSKLSYLHRDNDLDLVKFIFYLDKVKPENGPFSFCDGSTRQKRSYSQDRLFKNIDKLLAKEARSGTPSTDCYYRKWLKYPEFRRDFMALPKQFQGSSHFGDDLLPGTDAEKYYNDRNHILTTDKANAFVFAGNDLLHRGACVEEGDRWAIQVGLMARGSPVERWKRESKRRIKQLIHNSRTALDQRR